MKDNFTHLFFETIESLIPHYSINPLDAFANGNVAICVIDEEGVFKVKSGVIIS